MKPRTFGIVRQRHGWQLLCCIAGVIAAVQLHDALRPAFVPPSARPKASVRINVGRSQPQPVAAPTVTLPLQSATAAVAPRQKKTAPRRPLPEASPTATGAVSAPTPEPTESESLLPLPTLAQPGAPILPPVPAGPLPPLPPEEPLYQEVRGGDVLVLEVTVNDQGTVFDSRILVPSSRALDDLALLYAVRGLHWERLEPPLQHGETRTLELRLPYANPDSPTFLP